KPAPAMPRRAIVAWLSPVMIQNLPMAARKTPLDHGLWLTIIACLLYFAGRAPFAGQWDSFDYLKQIATLRLSDLGFGRPVFIAYNIALWETMRKVFGLVPHQLEAVAMA